MEGEQINIKNVAKTVGKSFSKGLLILLIIIVFIIFAVAGVYALDKSEFKKLSGKTATYDAVINEQGKVVYTYTDPDDETKTETVTPEQIVEDLKPELDKYADTDNNTDAEDKDEDIGLYLIGAEAVTKLPYIEPTGSEELVGRIKFYRYTEEEQANNAIVKDAKGNEVLNDTYRLTYKTPAEFETLKANYLSRGDTEVFKHFTLSSGREVIIAYGTQEIRTITTENTTVDGINYAADYDLTLEMVKQASGEQGYTGNYKDGFSMKIYSIEEKKIDYISLVEQYVMPKNFLSALLVQSGDANFVKAVADLAYNSEIAIGIYDNENYNEENEEYIYNKVMQISGETSLDFSKMQTTSPEITQGSLKDSIYSRIPTSCTFEAHHGNCVHTQKYQASRDTTSESNVNMYVAKVNANGKISTLGTKEAAQLFKINYKKTISEKSTPTVGMILADTWIAKWKASYSKQDAEDSSQANGTNEDAELIKYDTTDKLFDAFDTNMKSNIANKLTEHVNKLKEAAITEIINNTDFTIETEEQTEEDTEESKGSEETEVETEEDRKQHFKGELESQIKTNSTNLTGNITYANISYNSSNYQKTTKYNKQGTTEMDNAGKRFAEVFNNRTYHDAKYALISREEWFWEYIREAEDTAKLEDVIRYLLNIATDSTDYGTFDQQDINNLFKVFEPNESKTTGGVGQRQAFTEWLKHFENDAIRQYINGTGGVTYEKVETYIAEKDGQRYGKCYYTSGDGCWNYTYGIMVCSKEGKLNNKAYFEKYGYDLEKLVNEAKNGGEALVPIEILDQIYADLIEDIYENVKEYIEKQKDSEGNAITMEIYQYYALTNVAYQYGNCGQYIKRRKQCSTGLSKILHRTKRPRKI